MCIPGPHCCDQGSKRHQSCVFRQQRVFPAHPQGNRDDRPSVGGTNTVRLHFCGLERGSRRHDRPISARCPVPGREKITLYAVWEYDTEAARKRQEEKEPRKHLKGKEGRARYDALLVEIGQQKRIIQQNKGWSGEAAKRSKAAQTQLDNLLAQLEREFPKGRP